MEPSHEQLSQLAPRQPGDPLVEAELHRLIEQRGKITFAEFMQVALYLISGGYYEAHVGIGPQGDFLTSPETHPIFGGLLTNLIVFMWKALDRPSEFHIIEYGAGAGSLCRQILTAAPHADEDFSHALRYQIIEASAYLRALQQAQLIDISDRIEWSLPSNASTPVTGCVLSNELLDAFPVHRLQMTESGLQELFVGLDGGEYVDAPGGLSSPLLEAHFQRLGSMPPVGSVVEVNLSLCEWLQQAADRIGQGYLVTLDYGGSAEDLYGQFRPRGNLRCSYQHGWTDDPYDRPGLQDISIPVDFTTLSRCGESLGLKCIAELSQRDLLQGLGLNQALAQLEKMHLGVMERERNRKAMLSLADPKALGAYRALIQRKNAPEISLTLKQEVISPWLPLLPEEETSWPEV